MKDINEYAMLVKKLLEEPRNELINMNNSKYDDLINKYDKELLEKYKNIEKMLDEEFKKEE